MKEREANTIESNIGLIQAVHRDLSLRIYLNIIDNEMDEFFPRSTERNRGYYQNLFLNTRYIYAKESLVFSEALLWSLYLQGTEGGVKRKREETVGLLERLQNTPLKEMAFAQSSLMNLQPLNQNPVLHKP